MTDPGFEERRQKTIWERIDEVGEEHRLAHKGHRTRIEQLEHHADALDADLKALTATVTAQAAAPVEATKLRFSTGVLITVIGMTAGIVGGTWKITTKIDALGSEMARQSEDDRKERANLAKLYDERNSRYEKSLDTLTRQVELLKYEQQRLREDVTKKGSPR